MYKLKFLLFTFIFVIMFSFPTYADNLPDQARQVPDFSHLIVNPDGGVYQYFVRACNFSGTNSKTAQWEVYVLTNEVHATERDSNGIYKTDSAHVYKAYYRYVTHDSWSQLLPDNYTGYLSIGCPIDEYNNNKYDENLVYSSYDIKMDGNVVFQGPRSTPMSRLVKALPMTMRTGVLRQLVYLVPCLISLVIGLIAFRKAWKFLKMELSRH